MIERVQIRNFRSIRELDTELAPFTVLVGPNGAGKTNLVQAMETLGRMVDVGSTDPVRDLGWDEVRWRGTPRSKGGITLGASLDLDRSSRIRTDGTAVRHEHLRVAFTIGLGHARDHGVDVSEEQLEIRDGSSGSLLGRFAANADGAIEAQVEDEGRIGSLLGGHPVRELVAWMSRDQKDRRFLRIFGAASPMRFLVRGPLQVFRFRFDASSLRAETAHPTRELLGNGANLARAILERRGDKTEPKASFAPILAGLRLAYPRIEDVRAHRIGHNRLTLQFKERGVADWLDQSSVSDGVLHALGLLVVTLTRGQGLAAIEEPENALHPWAARALVDLAQAQRSRQVLVTTHSETVVSAIHDPRSLFVVERGPRGTTMQRATDRERSLGEILRSSGQRLGDVWLDGSLGGVPEGPA